MTNAEVIALRQKLKTTGNSRPLMIVYNENFLINEENSLVAWDDTNGVLYSLEANDDPNSALRYPAKAVCVQYDQIVSITKPLTKEDTEDILEMLIGAGLTNASSKEGFINLIFNDSSLNSTASPATSVTTKTSDMVTM